MKNIFISFLFLFALSANAMEKETTFNQKLFNKAQSEGKVIIISSWIKYCSSCAGQMKILNKAKKLTKTPLVAIGGINYSNYKKLLLNKADFLAISGYIWNNKKLKPLEAIKKLK